MDSQGGIPPPVAAPQPSIVVQPTVPVQPNMKLGFATKAIILVILAVGIGTLYAYSGNLWPFGPALSDAQLIEGLPAKLSEISYLKYNAVFSVISMARAPGALPLTQDLLQLGDDSEVSPLSALGGLPSDIDLRLHIDGASQTVTVSGLDTEFKAGVALKAGDFSLEADADFLMVDNVVYARVNKFPGLFIDLGPVKGQWIKITKEDLEGSDYEFPSSLAEMGDEGASQGSQVTAQVQKIYALGLESGFLGLTRVTTKDETVPDGVRRFATATDPAKLAEYYKAAAETLTSYGDKAIIKFDADTYALMQTQEFRDLYAYLSANTVTEVWIDGAGFPVKLTSTYQFIPDAAYAPNLSAVQFAITESIQFADINAPVAVAAPAESITFEDAVIRVSNMSPAAYRAQQQASRVNTLRFTLNYYYEVVGTYPATLNDLLKSPRQLGVPDDRTYNPEQPFLESLPKDYYTKADFEYQGLGSDFRLTYTMVLPDSADPDAGYLYETYVQGVNHASSRNTSDEKPQQNF